MRTKVVWRYLLTAGGALSVMTTGAILTLRWSAGSLDYLPMEHRLSPMPTLDEGRDQLFSIMFDAVDMRRTSLTAPIMDYLFTTVATMRMLGSDARVSVCVCVCVCKVCVACVHVIFSSSANMDGALVLIYI